MPYELAGVDYRTKVEIREAVQEVVARVPVGQDLVGPDHALVAALYEVRYPEDRGRVFFRSVNTSQVAPGRFVSTPGLSARGDKLRENWPEGGDFSWHKCIRALSSS